MKKTVAMFALAFSAMAMADTPSQSTQALPQNQPMLKLGVYDLSNNVPREVEKYSVSNKQHHLCWTAFNMPFEAKNDLIEVFTSPSKADFADNSGSISSSKDGKTHTITTQIASQNNQFVQRCWQFSKEDPIGKYSVKVRINNIEFPAQTFEVNK